MGVHTRETVYSEGLADGLTLVVKTRDLAHIGWMRSQGWASPMPDSRFVATVITAEKRVVTLAYGREVAEAVDQAKARLAQRQGG